MKSRWSRAARAAYVAPLAAAAVALAARLGGGVETDMLSLVDSSLDPDMRAAVAAASANARVAVEGTNWADVVKGAAAVREAFGAKSANRDFLVDLRGHADGLLDPASRALIISNDFAAVREAAEARLFGIAPPLLPVKEDPMLLASSCIEGLHGALVPGWSFRDGMPAKSADGMECALVSVPASSADPRTVADAMDALPAALPPGVEAHFSGAAFHAARSASRAGREIGALSAASLALALLFGWTLFRSLSFAGPLAAAMAAGGLVAAGALFAVYPRPHVMAFVFGTSLIGLSVDYVYHSLSAGGAAAVIRPMAQSFATTLACFAPLLFADVVVLRQMALFTIAGLSAVFTGVAAFCWRRSAPNGLAARSPRRLPFPKYFRLAILVAAVAGVPRLKMTDDPSALYRPDAALAADERRVAELLSANGAKIAFVRGATLQEALEREEDAGVENGLSRIVPSLRRQRENAALKVRLYAAEGAAYAERTGVKAQIPAEPRLLDPEKLPPESPIAAIVKVMWTGRGLISPVSGRQPSSSSPHYREIDMLETMRGVFSRVSRSTWRLFALSLASLAALLVLAFRRRAAELAAPVAAALAATAGMLGWIGVPFTFFTLLSLFVVLGLGLDYSIFHRGAERGTHRAVMFSFLTSLAGLGMLSFTAFPVTRGMGITFAFGLLFSYVFSAGSDRGASRVT